MSDQTETYTQEAEAQQPEVQITREEVDAIVRNLKSEQNMALGAVAGVLAGIAGAALWAGITIATNYQIGWIAIGVGFLVGFAIRIMGKGIEKRFGIVGAVVAGLSVALGNLLTVFYFIGANEGVPFVDVLVNFKYQYTFEVLANTFSPMDALFYSIAIYEGYKISFRVITEEEIMGRHQRLNAPDAAAL